jgi:predicted RNA-binding protein with TRAM domain
VVFVKNTKPGDKNIKIKINVVEDWFVTAQVVTRIPDSPSCSPDDHH